MKDKRPSSPRGRKPSSSSSSVPPAGKRASSPRPDSLSGAFPWKNKGEDKTNRPPRKRIKAAGDTRPDFEKDHRKSEDRPAAGFSKERRKPEGGFDRKREVSRPEFRKGEQREGFRRTENRPFKKDYPDSDKRFSKRTEGEGERRSAPRFDREGGRGGFRNDRDAGGRFKPRTEGEGERRSAPRFDREGGRGGFRNDRDAGGRFKPRTGVEGEKGAGRRPKGTDRLGKQAPNQFKQFRRGNSGFEAGKAPDYDLRKPGRPGMKSKAGSEEKTGENEIRLNRFISQSGLCSRREADVLISSGQITVNGKVVDQMGYKVKKDDVVKYGKRTLNREKLVYVLLNKPKDFLTTTEDPEERKTVMQLVANACEERIYPVGRLDRNTTGLLLLTNDGELSEKLMHPSYNIRKIYQVDLDKPISQADETKIREGVTLEDGFAPVDELEVLSLDRTILGISIHLGRNRIVRRIFESLNYKVEKLDRVMYAGLTKKDLPRGNWRYLTEKEVINLKYFS